MDPSQPLPDDEAPTDPKIASKWRPLLVVVGWLMASLILRLVIEVSTGFVIVGIGLLQGLSLQDLVSDPEAIEAAMSATLLGTASLIQLVALCALAVGFARLLGPDLRETFALKAPRWTAFGLAAVGGFTVGFFPGWIAQTLTERFPWLSLGNIELVNELLSDATWVGKLVMLVAIAIAAPILEELMFRGFLWSALDRIMPPVATWLLTSALFAIYHVDPVHVIAVFFTGLFLGWIRWTTGSIAPSIAAHFANNALAAVAVLAFPAAEEASNAGIPAIISVVVTLVLSALLWALRERPKPGEPGVGSLRGVPHDADPA